MQNASKRNVPSEELNAVNGGYGWDDTVDQAPEVYDGQTSWPGEMTWADASRQALPDTTQGYNDMHGIFSPGPAEIEWPGTTTTQTAPTAPLRDATQGYNDMHGIFTPGPTDEE